MTREQVLAKVKKLLNMTSENGATEGEIMNSMKIAQKLMAEYHLSSSELDDEKVDVTDYEIEEKTTGVGVHRLNLAATLAKHYRVMLYTQIRASKKRMHVIGVPEDVAIFNEVFEFSFKMFLKFSKIYMNKYPHEMRAKIKNSYLLGWVSGTEEALTNNEAQYALVLVRPKVVDEYVEKNLNLKPGKASHMSTASVTNGGWDAFTQGKTDADLIIRDKSSKKKLA